MDVGQVITAYFPYIVLLFNTLTFQFLRKILLLISPQSLKLIVAEIIATLELCAGCAELGVVYEIHGYLGLGIGLLLICYWWCYVWGDAEACPCGPFEECLFGCGIDSKAIDGKVVIDSKIIKQLIGQTLGGALTTFWIKSVWSFHMTHEHELLHTAAECQAGLQVHMAYGALIEGMITLISRLVALESSSWGTFSCVSANAIATTLLVLAATSTTGGFFNPVLATALTLGCEGNTVVEHFVVYWLGSLVGGFIGRYMYNRVRRAQKLKEL